jgi:hypothetical protein
MQTLIRKPIANPRIRQYPELAIAELSKLPSLQSAVLHVAEVYKKKTKKKNCLHFLGNKTLEQFDLNFTISNCFTINI